VAGEVSESAWPQGPQSDVDSAETDRIGSKPEDKPVSIAGLDGLDVRLPKRRTKN